MRRRESKALGRPRSFDTEKALGQATSLHGLDPAADYNVTFAETYLVKEKRLMTGKQLMHLHIEIGTQPGSLLIRYQVADTSRAIAINGSGVSTDSSVHDDHQHLTR
jgi:hypothetical protein